MKRGDRLKPGERVKEALNPNIGLGEDGKPSYLGGQGVRDPAASPRLRKAARTLSVSSRSSSSSEPAMETAVRKRAEGMF